MINIIIFNALFREMRTKKINKFSIFSANFVKDLQNAIYFMKNAVDEKDEYKGYSKLLQSIDNSIDENERQFGIRSVCKKGCFYCCKEKIAITDDEWKYIRQAISKLDNKEKKKIRKRAINSVNLLSMNNLQFDFNLKYDYDRFNKFDEKSYNKEYFKLNLICPLLSDDKTCLIYKSRPLTCIMYRNYGLTIDCKYNNGFNTYNFQEYSIWGDSFLQLKNKKAEKIKLLVNWIYDEKL